MNIIDIKRLYKKTKAAYERRTGNKLKWFMTQQQMANGTATICTAAVIDYAEAVAQAERAAAKAEAVARSAWQEEELKAAWEAAEGLGFTFWRDNLAKMTAEYGDVDGYAKAMQAAADNRLAEARAKLAAVGSQAEETERQVEAARQMAKEPEIEAFVEAVGGSTTVEVKREGWSNLVYLRFLYTADR